MINKKIRFSISLVLALVLTAVCVFAFASCGEKIEQIYITNAHSPRLNYVQGQDLELDSGALTVVVDGKETLVAMTDESVSVTGYDKNTLGNQTLTVTYGEHSTTYTVNVIPRTVAEGFEKQYFIGDSFNSAKGKIKIAKDDATTFTVAMNSPELTMQDNFDSSTPGTKTVTMQYNGTEGNFTCSFTVEVFGASDVTIVYPTKKNYYSHENELDFSGGYLTVKAGTNNSIVRHIDITMNMVEGFDISAVTPEHRTNPLTQNLTVTYQGYTFDKYVIKITYSGVSVIEDLLDSTLRDVDLDGDEITLTEDEAEAAIEAITEYYKLPNRQKQVLAEEDVHRIVRCATGKLNELYLEALKDVETTLVLKGNAISLIYSNCEDTKADVEQLKDDDHLINVYAELLRSISTDFPELILTGETKVAETIVVIGEETQASIIDAIEHIIELHSIMTEVDENDVYTPVPKEWTVENVADYEETILKVVSLIGRENFLQSGTSGIYNMLSAWRENDDFFEIIYSYYLFSGKEEYTDEYIVQNVLGKLPMPKVIGQWYLYWYNTSYISQGLYASGTELYMYDVTAYMYYYELLLEKTEEITKNESDKLSNKLLELMDYTALLTSARASYCGYYYLLGVLCENEKIMKLWDSYIELYKVYADGKLAGENGEFSVGEHAAKFDAVMSDLSALDPAELYGFLSSLNFLYGNSHDNLLVLSKAKEDGFYNTLSLLLHTYYSTELGEDIYAAFEKLVAAMESFSLLDSKDTALTDFTTAFADLNTLLSGLSNEQREKFNDHFEVAYNKCDSYYKAVTSTEELPLGATAADLFSKLSATVEKIIALNKYINSVEPDEEGKRTLKSGTYILLFALYEQAESYYNEIVAMGDTDNALISLFTKKYTINEKSTNLSKAFYSASRIYSSYITSIVLTLTNDDGSTRKYPTYDVYNTTQLNEYLELAADFIYAQYYGTVPTLSLDYVKSVIGALYACDLRGVSVFRAFEGFDILLDGLTAFYNDELKDDADTLALANELVEVVKLQLDYIMNENDEEKTKAFTDAFLALKAKYEALESPADFDNYLAPLYEACAKSYTDATAPDTETTT